MSIINSWQNDKDVKKFYDMVKQSAPKLNKAPETIKDKSLTYYIIDIMVDYYEEGKLDNEQEILAQIELIKNKFGITFDNKNLINDNQIISIDDIDFEFNEENSNENLKFDNMEVDFIIDALKNIKLVNNIPEFTKVTTEEELKTKILKVYKLIVETINQNDPLSNLNEFNSLSNLSERILDLALKYNLIDSKKYNDIMKIIANNREYILTRIEFLDFQNKLTPLYNNSQLCFPKLKTDANDQEILDYLNLALKVIEDGLKNKTLDSKDSNNINIKKQLNNLINIYTKLCKDNDITKEEKEDNLNDIFEDLSNLDLQLADLKIVSDTLRKSAPSMKQSQKVLNIVMALGNVNKELMALTKNNISLNANMTLKEVKELEGVDYWNIQIAIGDLTKQVKAYNRNNIIKNILKVKKENFKDKLVKIINSNKETNVVLENAEENIESLETKTVENSNQETNVVLENAEENIEPLETEIVENSKKEEIMTEWYNYRKKFDFNTLKLVEIKNVIAVLEEMNNYKIAKKKVYLDILNLFKQLDNKIDKLDYEDYFSLDDINDILRENEEHGKYVDLVTLLSKINVKLNKISPVKFTVENQNCYYKRRLKYFLNKVKDKTLMISEIDNVIYIIENLLNNEENNSKKAKLNNIMYHLKVVLENYENSFKDNDESLASILNNSLSDLKYKKMAMMIADLDWALGYKEPEKREIYKFFKTCKKYIKENEEQISKKKLNSWNNRNKKHLKVFKNILNPSIATSLAKQTANDININLDNLIKLDENGEITKESYVAYLQAKNETLGLQAKNDIKHTLNSAKEYVDILENDENVFKSVKKAYHKKVGFNVTIGALIVSSLLGLGLTSSRFADNSNNNSIVVDEIGDDKDNTHNNLDTPENNELAMTKEAILNAKKALKEAYEVMNTISNPEAKNELSNLIYSLNRAINEGSREEIINTTETLLATLKNIQEEENNKDIVDDNNDLNKPEENVDSNLEYIDFGTSVDITNDADLYTNMYNLVNDVNKKTSYYGTNKELERKIDAIVFSNEDDSTIVLAHNAEEATKYLNMNYDVDGYRLTNNYSFDKNGNIIAYEGYVEKEDVYKLNLKK